VSEIKIDKGIPIAPNTSGRRAIYPWAEMQIGDSFFVPGKTTRQFAGHFSRAKARYSMNFVVRVVTENEVTGVRVWRTE
jgi:hypothetical protein